MNINQFTDAIASAGLVPPASLIPDGKLHRFSANGKPSDDSGWYVLHMDYLPAGSFGCWRSGISQTWRADIGRDMSPDELLFMRERMETQKSEREAEEAKRKEDARDKARELWSEAKPCTEHPYLTKKGVEAHSARVQRESLVLPIRDEAGNLHSLQFISTGGEKRYLTGGRIRGCYFSIGKPDGVLCIAEGFATGATIHEATGYAVAVAFDAGNLLSVAQAMRARFPDMTIILCADDDYLTEGNTGITKAKESAMLIGGRVAIPQFGEKRPDRATDFNDLALHLGNEAVKACIDAAMGDQNAGGEASPLPNEEKTLDSRAEWPEPMPIPNGLLPVESFHYALLPESVREWVEDISTRMQCPPDFTAVGVMVALSSVIGCKACIQPKKHDDWQVTPNLWGVVVGRPGVMKSPALSAAIKPLDRLSARANAEYAEKVADFNVQKEIDEMSAKDNKTKAGKAIKNGNYEEATSLLRKADEFPPLEEPALRRYKVVDSTYEALGNVLMDNPWGVLAYRDELTGLLRSLDKEGQEGARSFYLQGYDGNQSYTFDRIMRGGNLTIPSVCISMLGGIQPAKLQRYIHDAVKGGSGDDGLLQRFGLLVWPDISPEWKNVDQYPDTEANQRACEIFERLDGMEASYCGETQQPEPAVYRFSSEAQSLFDDWRKSFENNLRRGDYHPAMESHLSKYRKLVPAVALVCALVDGETEVSHGSLVRALGWAEYLQSHAERAYAAGTKLSTESAVALLNKIKAGAISDGFKRADVYLKGWSYLSREDTQNATDLLCDLGYLRLVETRNPAGGRPSETYLINPRVMEGGK